MTRHAWKSLADWFLTGHRLLILILAIGIFVGIALGRDYGISLDEDRNAGVGAAALQVYHGERAYYDRPAIDEHGPAYFMFFDWTSNLFHKLAPSWTIYDGRHLTNYLMFMAAIAGFYFLAIRCVSKKTAALGTLLIASQPLLFGQAFINQKDIPFLSLVVVSMATGLASADRIRRTRPQATSPLTHEEPRSLWSPLRRELQTLSTTRKTAVALLLAVLALIIVDLLAIGLLMRLGESILTLAYQGHAPALIQMMFDRIATDAYKTPLDLYMQKFAVAWFAIRILGALVAAFVGWFVFGSFFPRTATAWGWSWRHDLGWQWAWGLFGSALVFGLTINVRQLGIFAGALVSGYALYRARAKAILPLVAYWAIALAVTDATWPYLWPSPITRFIGSLYLSANFPDTHVTFYRGAWLRSGTYPWYFFPNLAGVELTEPAVVLIALGTLAGVVKFIRHPRLRAELLILAAWIALPLTGLIVFHMTTYGNITHLLFVLPPLLILATIALEILLERLRRPILQAALAVLVILPGILGIVTLHPYENIYFNSFAGGVSGAADFYEMDRWCMSIREAIQDVNQIAPSGATVMLPSSYHQATPFARPDIRLVDNRTSYDEAQFVIDCTWIHGLGPWPQNEFRIVSKVHRGDAVLARIWERKPTE